MTRLRLAALAAGLSTSLAAAAPAADEPLPHVHVVFFTPADVAAPPGVKERLTEVADCAEAFLVRWMKHWGYPPERERIFDREEDGSLRVLFVKGKETLASGKYAKGNFEQEVRQSANARYRLGQHRHVWWIWVYVGDPPARFKGFVGGGSSRVGGTAFVNYDSTPGRIAPEGELASGVAETLMLKGCLHEFGHALGLPHDGPLERADLGMPLMGATVANYRRRTGSQERRVHLSEASAAMLWKHPLFTGTVKDRGRIPEVGLNSLAAAPERGGRGVRLSGAVESDVAAHSVVVLDSVPDDQEAYWQKPYVGRVGEQGRFEVVVSEPTVARAGTLRILVCFENGAVTGTGEKLGLPGALEKPYRVVKGTYRLTP